MFDEEFFKSLSEVIERGDIEPAQARKALSPMERDLQDLETCKKLECVLKQRIQDRYNSEGGLGSESLHDVSNLCCANKDFVNQVIAWGVEEKNNKR